MPDTPSNNNYASKSARFVSESQGLTDNTTKQTNATSEQSIKSQVIENGAIRDYLKSIDLTTKEILRKGVSQSSAKDRIKDEKASFRILSRKQKIEDLLHEIVIVRNLLKRNDTAHSLKVLKMHSGKKF